MGKPAVLSFDPNMRTDHLVLVQPTFTLGSAVSLSTRQPAGPVRRGFLPLSPSAPSLTLSLACTGEFFEENDVALAEAASNNPTAYIAETGWPTESMTPENATLGAAVAGVSELQTFLDTYPCAANRNGSYYFYFEPFDEPWKERYGGVEPVRPLPPTLLECALVVDVC